jgi:NTE family protein
MAESSAPLPLPDSVALVLQGGGALGSFQAGAYAALSRYDVRLDWVAGISIGAINAALIAGNPKGQRRPALRKFWDLVSGGLPALMPPPDRDWREAAHLMAAGAVAVWGVPGFFRPRFMPGLFSAPGSAGATSMYDTAPLADTLDRLVDWDLLNHGPMRFSVGAVDIESGNFAYFDNREGDWAGRIDARHILASGALPPGFPAVEIDGRHYWDGGLVSNTPLQHILDHSRGDTLVFQVDLFPAQGALPRDLSDVASREKDIRFSSRTRAVTDQYIRQRRQDRAICALIAKLPPALRQTPEVEALSASVDMGGVSVVQLIYRNRDWQTGARDFEFSPASILDHWHQGEAAVSAAMEHGDILAQNILDGATAAFDLGDPDPDDTHSSYRGR